MTKRCCPQSPLTERQLAHAYWKARQFEQQEDLLEERAKQPPSLALKPKEKPGLIKEFGLLKEQR